MSERDRQNPYDRSQQHGGRGSQGYDTPRQASQWQSDQQGGSHGNDWQQGSEWRQQGGEWQQDSGQRGGSDDYSGDYRFSGQTGSSRQDYRAQQEHAFGADRYEAGRSAGQSRGSYGGQDRGGTRGQQDEWQRAGSRDRHAQAGYRTPNYDASGGNDFGSFTSEDYGGRDFYNRGGGVSGGLRSSESYRPSYGISRLFDRDDDEGGRHHRDYNDWQRYGESRGFLKRAGDEIASWFGDEDAFRRREQDRREDHTGRGPSGYTRSDERIREDANDHLTHDWGVDASHVTVSVKDGEVTLEGTVSSRQEKRRAEDAVERVSGVKHVQNNLRVQDRAGGYRGSSESSASGSSQATGYGSGAASSSGSDATSASQATGASTTSGIGSTAASGIGSASTTRSSDKTS